jgi:hypothetical protein
MTGESGFPRRKRAGRGRDPQGPATTHADPSVRIAPREALDVARYVTDMTAQLEAMAVAARLDLLAYFLGMAKAEGDLFVRGNSQADSPAEESTESGLADPESGDDNSLD